MTKGRRRKIALLLVFALACTLCDFNNIGIKSAFASEETVSDTTSSIMAQLSRQKSEIFIMN